MQSLAITTPFGSPSLKEESRIDHYYVHACRPLAEHRNHSHKTQTSQALQILLLLWNLPELGKQATNCQGLGCPGKKHIAAVGALLTFKNRRTWTPTVCKLMALGRKLSLACQAKPGRIQEVGREWKDKERRDSKNTCDQQRLSGPPMSPPRQ